MGKQTFGEALRAARLARGWNQTDLVVQLREAGLRTTSPRVSAWECDRVSPSLPALGALVVVLPELGLAADELLRERGWPGGQAAAESADGG